MKTSRFAMLGALASCLAGWRGGLPSLQRSDVVKTVGRRAASAKKRHKRHIVEASRKRNRR